MARPAVAARLSTRRREARGDPAQLGGDGASPRPTASRPWRRVHAPARAARAEAPGTGPGDARPRCSRRWPTCCPRRWSSTTASSRSAVADADLLGLSAVVPPLPCVGGLGVPRRAEPTATRPRRPRRARAARRPARRRRRAGRGAGRALRASGPRRTWEAQLTALDVACVEVARPSIERDRPVRRPRRDARRGRRRAPPGDRGPPAAWRRWCGSPARRRSWPVRRRCAGHDTDAVLAELGYRPTRDGPSCRAAGGDRMTERSGRARDWLRNRAAIVGVGHTPYGKRGEHADKGHLRLVVEAITAACEDAGISPKDVDGYSSYYTSVEPSDLYAAFGAEAAQLRGADLGRRRRVDGRRVRQRGDGGRHRHGRVRRRAQGHDDGGRRPLRPGVRPDRPVGARRPAAPMAFSVPYGLQSPGQMFALAARRHMHRFGTTTEHFAEVTINARRMARHEPGGPLPRPDHGGRPPRQPR